MPFFKQSNLLYLHVPKTGGMSIEEYFFTRGTKMSMADVFLIKGDDARNEYSIYGWYFDKPNSIRVPNNRSLQHFTYQEILDSKEYFGIDFDTTPYEIIMSVRNPLDRMISEMFWNHRISLESTPEQVADAIYHYLHEDKENQDNHRLPQYMFGLDENGIWIPTIQIVHTENLEKEMHQLRYDDFHVHTNKCKSGENIDYKKYLNHRSIQMIQEYYAKDFEMFGYPLNTHYNTTIVTAFIQDINKNPSRNLEEYINFGKKLLNIPNPKIVFIDYKSYRDFFETSDDIFPLTTFVPMRKEDIYLYNYKEALTDFHLQGNEDKDTIDYLFVQCNKTEWIVKAIELNRYKTEQYIWIDFGINHMIREKENFESWVLKMTEQRYNHVRIAACKYKGYSVSYDVYRTLTWTFAGSVFGGNINGLLDFALLTKKEILKTIREKKTIMWEINIWYLIYRQYPDFFDMYTCGHDFRILDYY